jgi:hypothetical protein
MLSIDPAQAGFVQIVPEKTAVRSAASIKDGGADGCIFLNTNDRQRRTRRLPVISLLHRSCAAARFSICRASRLKRRDLSDSLCAL